MESSTIHVVHIRRSTGLGITREVQSTNIHGVSYDPLVLFVNHS